MKIFALNLCLDFTVSEPGTPPPDTLHPAKSWRQWLAGGHFTPGQTVQVAGVADKKFCKELFEFQADDIWRSRDLVIQVVFATEADRDYVTSKFTDKCKEVTAAGGVVINEKGEFLFILHRGVWTLPKGLVQRNEPLTEGALREVGEETGLVRHQLERFAGITRHTHLRKGKWSLKTTYWFEMSASSAEAIRPQLDEDITQVAWITPARWQEMAPTSYPLTRQLMEHVFLMNILQRDVPGTF